VHVSSMSVGWLLANIIARVCLSFLFISLLRCDCGRCNSPSTCMFARYVHYEQKSCLTLQLQFTSKISYLSYFYLLTTIISAVALDITKQILCRIRTSFLCCIRTLSKISYISYFYVIIVSVSGCCFFLFLFVFML
jgi:hypothetical protein